MKRLYFLVPTIDSASKIVKEVQSITVADNDIEIFIIGKDHIKIEAAHLREAGLLQTTDFLHALKRGAINGGLVGFLIGIILFSLPLERFPVNITVLLGLIIFGAGFGGWASTLVGISIPNPMVEENEKALEAGGLLMLVDIPKEKEIDVIAFIRKYHPEAVIQGISL